MSDMTRMVMCVPDGMYFHFDQYQKFCWLPKNEAETNPAYRQVIPYCAVKRESDDKFLVYDRAGGEGRLHGKVSFGIGGHIENGETFYRGMDRELKEEALASVVSEEYLGKICLDKTVVDQVHIGIAFLVIVSEAEPQEELLNARWLALDELVAIKGDLEAWSQVLLDFIVNPF